MRFNGAQGRHFGGGGLAGFFRPIIRFFKNIVMPGAKSLSKKVVNSRAGKKGMKALKKAAVNITADAISGGPTGKSPSTHISKARAEVADALRETQVSERLKKKKQKRFGFVSRKRDRKNESFF